MNGKQYIGSAKDLYLRLNEHLSHRKSNKALQAAISKYGLDNFNFCIYEYFTYENKATSFKLLTDLETMYIKKFNFSNLYNFLLFFFILITLSAEAKLKKKQRKCF